MSKVSSSFPAPTEEGTIQDRRGRPVPGRGPMEP
jgi:hypothetical protein